MLLRARSWQRIWRVLDGRAGLLLLAFAFCGHSQPLPSWERVEKLGRGTRINCLLTDESQVAGTLVAASANSLTVTEGGAKVIEVGREHVQMVWASLRPRGKMPLWIGLGTGVLVGAADGAFASTATSPKGRATVVGLGAAIFGAVGAGIGHLLRGSPKLVMVYRSSGTK